MEELLARIQNKEIAEYMREALGCYNAAAYRACIVLSYIAVFDDLRRKLLQLAAINSTAKAISKEVEQRAVGQQIYESYMVDQLKAEGLVSEIEAFRLDQIRILRNKAAHPSGLHPSPEEARYVYFETVDKFLSRPELNTTHAVDNILKGLTNNNFFPSRNIDDVKLIVSSEILSIHPLALPYLVVKLCESSDSTDATLSANAKLFVSGLCARDDGFTNQQLRERLIIPKANDTKNSPLLMGMLSVNPTLLNNLNSVTEIRLRKMAEASIESYKLKPVAGVNHPAQLLWKLTDKLGSSYVETTFHSFAEKVITTFCYTLPVILAAKQSSILRALLVNCWKDKAGSGDFATANTFADYAPELDSLLTFLEPEEAFDIVLAVCKGAQWGAFSAISLRDQTFSSTPVLAKLALQYFSENPSTAQQKAQNLLSLSVEEVVNMYLTSASSLSDAPWEPVKAPLLLTAVVAGSEATACPCYRLQSIQYGSWPGP